MKIAIIEDEKITAKDLARTLLNIKPSIQIVAMLHSVEEAVHFLHQKPDLDLIFSDIELGDGLSFDIFAATQQPTPIVFCTAYDAYALRAFESFGVDYLLKPFGPNSVAKALQKYEAMKAKFAAPTPDVSAMLQLLKQELHAPKTSALIVQQGDKIIPMATENMALFYIENELLKALDFQQKSHVINYKLEALEKMLGNDFFRANRQFLVNRLAIKDASHYFNRKILLNLNVDFPEQILVGKLKVSAFLAWLAG
jgi:two-component system, LytTR family, response regulator LytT